jgi:NAD(P)-dependent dehydrogenase (short-subunit alcohol dehydrogenase family)
MDLELKDKAFLITGGTDGLGLALAQRLVGEGGHVAVCGRDGDRLARAQALLGGDALCLQTDVTEAAQLDAFVDAALSRFGRLDGLVNNAGQTAGSSIATSSDEQWRRDYELKVIAALHLARAVLPALEVTKGAIINVLAILARAPGVSTTPTSASRLAGLALTKSLASEVGPRGIRANAILIGIIESGQWVRRAEVSGISVEEFYETTATNAHIPLGRVGRADEFADLASYLLSPRASYVTGVGIALDGGLSPVI